MYEYTLFNLTQPDGWSYKNIVLAVAQVHQPA